MLDWTTSFLSDETIIKLSEESVKHFLGHYHISEGLSGRNTTGGLPDKNAPHFPRGIDENQEATPVALYVNLWKINPTCDLKMQFVRHAEEGVK